MAPLPTRPWRTDPASAGGPDGALGAAGIPRRMHTPCQPRTAPDGPGRGRTTIGKARASASGTQYTCPPGNTPTAPSVAPVVTLAASLFLGARNATQGKGRAGTGTRRISNVAFVAVLPTVTLGHWHESCMWGYNARAVPVRALPAVTWTTRGDPEGGPGRWPVGGLW